MKRKAMYKKGNGKESEKERKEKGKVNASVICTCNYRKVNMGNQIYTSA